MLEHNSHQPPIQPADYGRCSRMVYACFTQGGSARGGKPSGGRVPGFARVRKVFPLKNDLHEEYNATNISAEPAPNCCLLMDGVGGGWIGFGVYNHSGKIWQPVLVFIRLLSYKVN